MQNIEETIREIIICNVLKMHSKDLKITLETNLAEDLGMDSISLMMMVVLIEERFNIELPEEFFAEETLSNYGNVVAFVTKLMNSN